MRRTGLAWPRITVGQMMRIVLISAAGFAAAAPFAIPWRKGVTPTPAFLIALAFAVPLALALASLVVVREGPWKDRLVFIELLVPVTTGLVLLLIFGYWTFWGRVWPPWTRCLGFALALSVLSAAFPFLVDRLLRQFRPHRKSNPIVV